MKFTKQHFFNFSKVVFMLTDNVNAITISRVKNGKKSGCYLTLWKDLNFERKEIELKGEKLFYYESTKSSGNIITEIPFAYFEWILNTKGCHLFTREELGINNIVKCCKDPKDFILQFGILFFIFPTSHIKVYDEHCISLIDNKCIIKLSDNILFSQQLRGFVCKKEFYRFVLTMIRNTFFKDKIYESENNNKADNNLTDSNVDGINRNWQTNDIYFEFPFECESECIECECELNS